MKSRPADTDNHSAMPPSRPSTTELPANHAHTALAVSASLVVGIASGLQAWNTTGSMVQSIVIGAAVAIIGGALFRMALDGSWLWPVIRRWMTEDAKSSDTASGLTVLKSQPLSTGTGLTRALLAPGSRMVRFNVPTAAWGSFPSRPATLNRAFDKATEEFADDDDLAISEAAESFCCAHAS